jgi:hypothetical protein
VKSSSQPYFLFARQATRATGRVATAGVGRNAFVDRRDGVGRYLIPGGAEYPERRLTSAEGLRRADVASWGFRGAVERICGVDERGRRATEDISGGHGKDVAPDASRGRWVITANQLRAGAHPRRRSRADARSAYWPRWPSAACFVDGNASRVRKERPERDHRAPSATVGAGGPEHVGGRFRVSGR